MNGLRIVVLSIALAGPAILLGTTGGTLALFTTITSNPGNTVQTAGSFAPVISGQAASQGRVALTWTTDSNLAWVSYYTVYSSIVSGGPYLTRVNTQAVTACAPLACTQAFTFTPSSSANFFYIVRGTNGNGVQGFDSNEVVVAADQTPPFVTAVSPYDGASGVTTAPTVTLFFNKSMDVSATNAAIQLIQCNTGAVSPTCNLAPTLAVNSPVWSNSNTVASFQPTAALTNSTFYRVRVTTSARDVGQNALAVEFNSVFRTFDGGTPPSTNPPNVVPPTNPSNQSTGVVTNTSIVINYSETMNQSATNAAVSIRPCTGIAITDTVNTSAATCAGLKSGAGLSGTVSFSASWSGAAQNVQTIDPSDLAESTWHQVSISATATSLAGLALTSAYNFVFQTGSTPDFTAPDPPVILAPAATAYTTATIYTLSGYVTKNSGADLDPGALLRVYRDGNNNGVFEIGVDPRVGSLQLSGGTASFNINVGLFTGQANRFFITAQDAAGNLSSAATAPTIYQADNGTGPGALIVTSGSNSGVIYVDALVAFQGDQNGNSTALARLCVSTCSTIIAGAVMTRTPTAPAAGPGEFRARFNNLGLTPDTVYTVTVVVTDTLATATDGINNTANCNVSSTATTCEQRGTVQTESSGNQGGLISPPSGTLIFAPRAGQTATITTTGSASAMRVVIRTSPPVTLVCDTAAPFVHTWDGKDGNGNHIPDGQYTYTIEAFQGNNCGNAASQYDGNPIIVSNVGSVSMSPPPGAVTLGDNQSVAIIATVYNYRNELVTDGATVNFTATAAISATNFTITRTTALTGERFSGCDQLYQTILSGSGQACTVLRVNTAVLQMIAVSATVASQNLGFTTARTIVGTTFVNDPPYPPEDLQAIGVEPAGGSSGARAATRDGSRVAVTFRWKPSKSPNVVAYDLYVSGEPGRPGDPLRVEGTETVVGNLVPGRVYYLAMRSINRAGQAGPLSATWLLTVPGDSGVAAPTTQPAPMVEPTPTATAAPAGPTPTATPVLPTESWGGVTPPRPAATPPGPGGRLDLFLRSDELTTNQRDWLDPTRPTAGLVPADTDGDGVPGWTLRPTSPGQPSHWAEFISPPITGRIGGAGDVRLFVNGPAGSARFAFEIWTSRTGPNGPRTLDRLIANSQARPLTVPLDGRPGQWQPTRWTFSLAETDLAAESLVLRVRLEQGPLAGVSLAYDRAEQAAGVGLTTRTAARLER